MKLVNVGKDINLPQTFKRSAVLNVYRKRLSPPSAAQLNVYLPLKAAAAAVRDVSSVGLGITRVLAKM